MENRIQKIIDVQAISLNAFAQEIGVNRSTVSHILTARNKPSVEVLQKILKRFPSISTDWLLFGTGAMHVKNEAVSSSDKASNPDQLTNKTVDKVVVFFTDNTFQEYKPC